MKLTRLCTKERGPPSMDNSTSECDESSKETEVPEYNIHTSAGIGHPKDNPSQLSVHII